MIKLKECKLCKESLPREQFTSVQAKYCKKCLLIHKLELKNAMMQRSLDRTKTKKQKTVGIVRMNDLKKQAQKLFNKFIRLRDFDDPCISCQNICGDWDAGHFWAQGMNGALRFEEDNVHKQGRGCNRFKHGNLLEYRLNLVKKIGEDRVKWLDEHHGEKKKWTREELGDVIATYKQKVSDLTLDLQHEGKI